MRKIALIDFDPIFYIVGHTYREAKATNPGDVYDVKKSVNSIIDLICTMTGSDQYLIALSDETCFRNEIYKYDKYKGNRGEKPDFIKQWKPVILAHIREQWVTCLRPNFEADDIIATLAEKGRSQGIDYVVCSPDKDLRQIPGAHFDYTKSEGMEVVQIDHATANRNLWMQILMGDATDNVAGVPGIGLIKAIKILEGKDPVEYRFHVEQAYCKYFGPYYGLLIFDENRKAVTLRTDVELVTEIGNYIPSHERVLNTTGPVVW